MNGCLLVSLKLSPLPSFLFFSTLSPYSTFTLLESIRAFPCPNRHRSLLQRPVPFFPSLPCKSSSVFSDFLTYSHFHSLRAATQPPQSNLKERIAALQQCNGPLSPTPPPTSAPRDASLTPPRGSLRDKIAKFERKGGVPIPRSSFGIAAPPPEDAGSTKSRELYGNRVAALGKGRPTAPGNSSHRAVTSPAISSVSPSSRTSPDGNAAKSAEHLTPNDPISPASSSTPLPFISCPGPSDRPDGPLDVVDRSDKEQDISVQLAAEPQLESLAVTRDLKSLEPSNKPTKPTVSTGHRPPAVSSSSSPTGLVATTLTRDDVSSTTPRANPSDGTPTQAGGLATSNVHKGPSIPSEPPTQDCPPAATPKSTVSAVQAHISEQVPVKEATTNANTRGFRLDRPSQNSSLAIPSTNSDAPSATQLPSSGIITSTDSLEEGSTSISSDAPVPSDQVDPLPSSNSTPATTVALPSTVSSTVSPVSGDLDDSTTMSPPPVAEPGRRSFSAVVHRGDSDNLSDSRHSTASRTSTITPRPSSSSFKTGTDGGVVRSKRNFKHLGAVAADPSPSPSLGDLGTGDLAALLQEAAWLEQRLSDETLTLTVPSALGDEWEKVEKSVPLSATKTAQVTTRAPVATSTRTKWRGLTLDSSTSAPFSDIAQSPIRSSPSTPSFQVHPDVSPTVPKSARGRKYFSLRAALRGPRLSVSSEMSSDDSALVATPPSPSFDLAMQQAAQAHGNDSMSIRSMFSIRSNRSGKSESAPGSLRLSPRRGVARASSFAERLLNRATKTKSMLDDPGELASL